MDSKTPRYRFITEAQFAHMKNLRLR